MFTEVTIVLFCFVMHLKETVVNTENGILAKLNQVKHNTYQKFPGAFHWKGNIQHIFSKRSMFDQVFPGQSDDDKGNSLTHKCISSFCNIELSSMLSFPYKIMYSEFQSIHKMELVWNWAV